MNIRTDSTEYVYSTVTADHDLTGKTIEVALPVAGTAPDTWYAATVTNVVENASTASWTATYRILVGPSGGLLTLGAGTYDWTFRLTDSPEQPVRKTGSVIATTT